MREPWLPLLNWNLPKQSFTAKKMAEIGDFCCGHASSVGITAVCVQFGQVPVHYASIAVSDSSRSDRNNELNLYNQA